MHLKRSSFFYSKKILEKEGLVNCKYQKEYEETKIPYEGIELIFDEVNGHFKRNYRKEIQTFRLVISQKFTFKIKIPGNREDIPFEIPIKIIYDKNLSISQKLSLIWNQYLKVKNDQLNIREIANLSGISEKTIYSVKRKYPELFV
ncbi:MAG: hypothetical protein AB1410_02650 [Acidobacteriota bacterium]